MEKVRETLEECIVRVGTCRCRGNYGPGTIGVQHKTLPAIVALCIECARKTQIAKNCPEDFEIVQMVA
jgi:hypothetical protein